MIILKKIIFTIVDKTKAKPNNGDWNPSVKPTYVAKAVQIAEWLLGIPPLFINMRIEIFRLIKLSNTHFNICANTNAISDGIAYCNVTISFLWNIITNNIQDTHIPSENKNIFAEYFYANIHFILDFRRICCIIL